MPTSKSTGKPRTMTISDPIIVGYLIYAYGGKAKPFRNPSGTVSWDVTCMTRIPITEAKILAYTIHHLEYEAQNLTFSPPAVRPQLTEAEWDLAYQDALTEDLANGWPQGGTQKK